MLAAIHHHILNNTLVFPRKSEKGEYLTKIVHNSQVLSLVWLTYFLHSRCASNTGTDAAEDLWPLLRLSPSSLRNTGVQHREGVHCESLFINSVSWSLCNTARRLCLYLKALPSWKGSYLFLKSVNSGRFTATIVLSDWVAFIREL